MRGGKYCLAGFIAAILVLTCVSAASAAGTITGAFSWRPDLDPQVSWSNYGENVIYDTYIPLLTYKHAGGRAGSDLIPGLARSRPRITDRGRTYTLYLRKGLRYSDGEAVRASDFKFAVERMFRIASGGPAYFYDDIVGAKAFERTRHGGIPGIVTADRSGRIVVHLVRPEQAFSRKLAMMFVAPVPPSTPMRVLSSHLPPATGPYVISHSTRRSWTYTRNPEWPSHNHELMPRIPSGHLNRIKVKVIHRGAKAIREVEQGKIDWISQEMSGPAYLSLRHRFPTRTRLEPTLSTEFFWLNTSIPPFNDVRVRRAVNYAVDRSVFKRLSGGQVSPTEQILPPNLPGYRKSSSYPFDMAKARRLIAAANPSVRKIALWTYGQPGELEGVEYAAYFAAVLDELGFTVDLKVVSPGSYLELIGNSRRANLDAGVGGWVANYPDPSDFFGETLDSRVRAFDNENLSQLFVPSLTREFHRLETRPGPVMPEGRYAALDRAYMRLAPWVPFGNTSVPVFVSKRIELGKVISNPSFGIDLTSLRIGKRH